MHHQFKLFFLYLCGCLFRSSSVRASHYKLSICYSLSCALFLSLFLYISFDLSESNFKSQSSSFRLCSVDEPTDRKNDGKRKKKKPPAAEINRKTRSSISSWSNLSWNCFLMCPSSWFEWVSVCDGCHSEMEHREKERQIQKSTEQKYKLISFLIGSRNFICFCSGEIALKMNFFFPLFFPSFFIHFI